MDFCMVSLKPLYGVLSVKTQFGGQDNFISLNDKGCIVVIIVEITGAATTINSHDQETLTHSTENAWDGERSHVTAVAGCPYGCHNKVPPTEDFEQHPWIPFQC